MFESVWRSEEPDKYFVVPAVPVQLFPVFLFDLGCDVKSDFLSACVTHFGGDSLVTNLEFDSKFFEDCVAKFFE
jgi:hypothetical protein